MRFQITKEIKNFGTHQTSHFLSLKQELDNWCTVIPIYNLHKASLAHAWALHCAPSAINCCIIQDDLEQSCTHWHTCWKPAKTEMLPHHHLRWPELHEASTCMPPWGPSRRRVPDVLAEHPLRTWSRAPSRRDGEVGALRVNYSLRSVFLGSVGKITE